MSQNRILNNQSSLSEEGYPTLSVWQATLSSTNDIFAHNTGGIGVGTYDSAAKVMIINDTFHSNGQVGIETYNAASTVYVTNTIIYKHEVGLRRNDPASTLISNYNLLSNTTNYAGGVTPGANDIKNKNPLFVDAANNNFHLDSSSPAIDKGTSNGAPPVDFEDESRPQGPKVDIGVDERLVLKVYIPVIQKKS
jgi:hypothetical protein